jgi:hypothetical protein
LEKPVRNENDNAGGKSMNPDRRTSILTGLLFIVATAFSLVSTSIVGPILGASDYLTSAAANSSQVTVGVLFLLAAAGSIVLIPAALFPVLRRHNESIAMGYFGLRTIEAVTLVVDAIVLLLLVSTGQQYVKAGHPASSYFQAAGTLWLTAHNWIFSLNPVIFGSGALMFYFLLYRSRLIPRWLSAWGLLGAVLIVTFGLMGVFGTSLLYLAVPIAVQEMAMALWFIVKGFNTSATLPPAGRAAV